MSWVSGGELVTGGWTSSNYAGHGIPFENLPTTGENGGSPLLDDGGISGDEIRWGPATVTSGSITVTLYEDGSFESTGGAGSFTYPWWRNGTLQTDESVVINSAGATVSFAMPQFTVSVSAEAAVPSSGATVSFTMPQFSVSVDGENAAPVNSANVAFSMPQFSVAVSAESFVSGNAASVSFTMPQFSVAATAGSTVPENSANIAFAMPQFAVQVFSGEFEYFNAPKTMITYIAESTEITYNP